MTFTWRIDTAGQTLALASDGALPRVIWWGPSLPTAEDLAEVNKIFKNRIFSGLEAMRRKVAKI